MSYPYPSQFGTVLIVCIIIYLVTTCRGGYHASEPRTCDPNKQRIPPQSIVKQAESREKLYIIDSKEIK